ncbi:VIT1/CCC1 transporter family protein [Nonomuraea roseoviolacea subsp. roseoviolacea]|uniref:VIT1/CCC1 family predicted Fe2+/Mn2+ transporter n=1 Tax=Nonomuraea roseoviolacea subsp. carminata TaxID=160689 RepID=A0ABT1KEK4_9ACTN|nr:VIT1/CCC1 transporter family protein [Nonomuraea roseoviolacea]MCP2352454.1 VIT1/CCC1 family predicted Fe2+/Mn2+ transporter [Nonomuraea roseoviolacea subsp. carminata]
MTVELAQPQSPELHHTHRDVTGGWLRPAVFGAMDGLVSNFALIAGVVGAAGAGRGAVLAGFAGLVAGACSMAAGEYTSVKSQTELMRAEIAVERRELARNPEGEQAELAALYRARGLDADLARKVAAGLSADPEQALRVHVREELGVDPDDLPSPRLAAASSFGAFAAGALVPLAPFLFGASGLTVAVVLSVLALFGFGAVVARMTARPWWLGGLRQLALGVGAAAATFGIGHLLGVTVS